MAKRLVRDAGVPTPAFAVAELGARARLPAGAISGLRQADRRRDRQRLRGGSLVVNASRSLPPRRALIARYRQPVLVETYLPGREFTVGIVGNGEEARVLGVCEILLKADAEANIYSLHNKELCEELVTYAPRRRR